MTIPNHLSVKPHIMTSYPTSLLLDIMQHHLNKSVEILIVYGSNSALCMGVTGISPPRPVLKGVVTGCRLAKLKIKSTIINIFSKILILNVLFYPCWKLKITYALRSLREKTISLLFHEHGFTSSRWRHNGHDSVHLMTSSWHCGQFQIIEAESHWFKSWLGAHSAPSQHLNQCWHIVS